jgi:hypothetical protein
MFGPARLAQSASCVQGLQMVGDEHTGVAPGQSALVTQVTQAPLEAQSGLAGSRLTHAPALLRACVQPTQEPVAKQKGLLTSWQSVSVAHSRHAPVALQVFTDPPQAMCPVFGAPETTPHVPGMLPLQNSHEPLHGVLQQTPSEQLLVLHCEPAVHACPGLPLQAPLGSQVPVQRPFGSSIPFTVTQAWLFVLHIVQISGQSLFVQQSVLGMHIVVPFMVHERVEPAHE